MPAAEDRQAKALEGIDRNIRELVRVMATMNENFVAVFAALKGVIDKEEARVEEHQQKLDLFNSQMKTTPAPDRDPREDVIVHDEETAHGEDPNICGGCGLLHCEIPGCNVKTPAEWMDHLKRWWNYESIANTDDLKLSKAEFLSYMTRARGTEITYQVPDIYRNRED